MASYGLFLILATLTVLSPGPGVVLTISNALRHGWAGSLPGICGIALGAFIVAGISASGAGLILATSATAFTVLKYAGALYLLYLGIKMWRTQRFIPELSVTSSRPWRRFVEALSIQLLNPKAGFFFWRCFLSSSNRPETITLSSFCWCLLTACWWCWSIAVTHSWPMARVAGSPLRAAPGLPENCPA
ncbi:LysE family translocator [Pseudomonas sp. 10S4]|nr:LysE family translocator [Pseudomonas sp. 10S4]WPX18984.1 LysE family translocator [Pseudomonas sp. 10S4]